MNESLIFSPTPNHLRRGAELLREGKIVGIPTETVYGLAANATDPDAVAKIFAAKGRPPNNPLIIHVPSAEDAGRWVRASEPAWMLRQWNVVASLWPGPLTVVVPRGRSIADAVTAGRDTVAIRVPDHPVTLELLRLCDFPLAAPSANPSNYISPTLACHVAEGLGEKVSMVIDGGVCRSGVESTIIQLAEAGPRLLRPGGISVAVLSEAFEAPIEMARQVVAPDQLAMVSPGQFPRHYSPRTPLRIVGEDGGSSQSWGDEIRVARIVMSPLSDQEASAYHRVWTLSNDGDLEEAARMLFAAMREADASDCDLILIDACSTEGIGEAIMDRIRRAAASDDGRSK